MMTLRLRLALFYTLLVAVVLALSGMALHLLLRRNLYESLESSLREAANLLSNLAIDTEEALTLQDEEHKLQLPSDLTALLFDTTGTLQSSLGRVPQPLPNLEPGFSTSNGWRGYAEAIQGGTLVLLRDTERISESLRQFDSSFFVLAPLAVLLAFGLGYTFAGRALNPVTVLTQAAYDLAQRRVWRETLPEPKQKDELWQLTKAINTLLETLANVIETEKRFTADAAHELRTPLTVLQGRLEQALERNRDPSITPLLGKSAKALEDLLTLVEKLLLLARTESGQGLHKELINFNELIIETAEMMRPLFEQKKLELSLKVEPLVFLKGDRVALGLLIRNLLENALKFTESGKVVVGLRKTQQAQLSIEDTGIGIPLNFLPHIFERFYQTDIKHRQHGNGLGLALVKSIVQWHGGEIFVQPRVGGGTVFLIKLSLE